MVAIAALYRCLVRALIRRPEINADVGPIERGVCAENIWQAQRAGVGAQFVDAVARRLVPVTDLVAATLELVAEDAELLGCGDWLGRIGNIIARGTSADHQLVTFRAALAHDQDDEAALRSVIRALTQGTIA